MSNRVVDLSQMLRYTRVMKTKLLSAVLSLSISSCASLNTELLDSTLSTMYTNSEMHTIVHGTAAYVDAMIDAMDAILYSGKIYTEETLREELNKYLVSVSLDVRERLVETLVNNAIQGSGFNLAYIEDLHISLVVYKSIQMSNDIDKSTLK